MGGKRYISHVEEFQIIYVATYPSRRWSLIPYPLNVGYTCDLIPKTRV